jgi:hypothetical protein
MSLFRACRVLRSADTAARLARARDALVTENDKRHAVAHEAYAAYVQLEAAHARLEAATHRVCALRLESAKLLSERWSVHDTAVLEARVALEEVFDETADVRPS